MLRIDNLLSLPDVSGRFRVEIVERPPSLARNLQPSLSYIAGASGPSCVERPHLSPILLGIDNLLSVPGVSGRSRLELPQHVLQNSQLSFCSRVRYMSGLRMLPGGAASEPGLPTFADPESVAIFFFPRRGGCPKDGLMF